ncbi:MAG: hypothetical protein AB1567_08485 [bacterium]
MEKAEIEKELAIINQTLNGLEVKIEDIRIALRGLIEDTKSLNLKFVLVENTVKTWEKLNLPQAVDDLNNLKKLGVFKVVNSYNIILCAVGALVVSMLGVVINAIIKYLR